MTLNSRVDNGLHAHRFFVQMLECAKALHPCGLIGAGAALVRRQLVAQRLSDELFKRQTASSGGGFGFAQKLIR